MFLSGSTGPGCWLAVGSATRSACLSGWLAAAGRGVRRAQATKQSSQLETSGRTAGGAAMQDNKQDNKQGGQLWLVKQSCWLLPCSMLCMAVAGHVAVHAPLLDIT